MDEKFLHHIWDGLHLNAQLQTVSGKKLRIAYQGQYNTGRGADFLNAGIVIDDYALRGDVEIHKQTSDWHAHNHSDDPFYNNVVLHVVYSHNSAHNLTIKENGETTEILELQSQLSQDINKLLEEHTPRLPNVRPSYCDLLSALDRDRLQMTLRDIGTMRFMGKVRRFNASLMFSDFDQILYEGIFEAMGYDKNKTAMLHLAQELSLAKLLEFKEQGCSNIDILAIVTVASGILDRSGKLIPESLSEMLQDSWQNQNCYSKNLPLDWQLFRIRPANHPIYRIMATLPMCLHYGKDGLLQAMLSEAHPKIDAPKRIRALQAMFANTVLPGAEKFPQPGKSVLNSLYLNIFLPIFQLWAAKTNDTELQNDVREAYQKHPGLAQNHITRMMGSFTDPQYQKMIDSRAIYQQALIELHHRYCRFHLCDECFKLRCL